MSEEYRIVNDIDECRNLWERFSPKRSIFDLWEYRFPFWDAFRYQPSFILLGGYGDERGLLPLWFHPEQKRYLWFGDLGDECDWQEDTMFWVTSSADVNDLLSVAPRPLLLTCLSEAAVSMLPHHNSIEQAEPKCVLQLHDLPSAEAYLDTLPKKLRQNLRRDRRRIEQSDPKIEWDQFRDFPELIRLNTEKFSDSPFHDALLVRIFENIIRTGRSEDAPYSSHMLSVRIGGEIAAVDCIFVFGEIMYALLCGSDTRRFPGIGNAMHFFDIDRAIALRMKSVDFAEADYGAKKLELFPNVPLFKLTLE